MPQMCRSVRCPQRTFQRVRTYALRPARTLQRLFTATPEIRFIVPCFLRTLNAARVGFSIRGRTCRIFVFPATNRSLL